MSGPIVIRNLYPSRIDATIVVFHELVKTVDDNGAGDKFDETAHGYPNDMAFKFSGTPPSPEFDTSTVYYIVNKNNDDFQVSLTKGGSVITFDDDGVSPTVNPQFVVPDGVTRIFVEVYGGGGGGGSGNDSTASIAAAAAGGGAGGVAEGFVVVTPGGTIAYIIGTGGAGSTSESTDGNSGVNSTFGALTGNGGGAGSGASNNSFGSGGAASGGDVNITGGSSSGSVHLILLSVCCGMPGGSNKKGAGGYGNSGAGNGANGNVFGGGGGGGGAASIGASTYGDGGDGGVGGIIIWY